MRRLCTFGFVTLAISVLLVYSCGGKAGKVIGVISKGQAHQFWQSIHAGAAAAAKEFGVTILWNGPAEETDFSRQIQIANVAGNPNVRQITVTVRYPAPQGWYRDYQVQALVSSYR